MKRLVLPVVAMLSMAGAAGPAWAADKNPQSCIAASSTRGTIVQFLLYAGRGENLPQIGHWSLAPNAPMADLTVTSTNQNVRGTEFTINAPQDVTAGEQIWFDGTVRPGFDGAMCQGTTYVIFH